VVCEWRRIEGKRQQACLAGAAASTGANPTLPDPTPNPPATRRASASPSRAAPPPPCEANQAASSPALPHSAASSWGLPGSTKEWYTKKSSLERSP
jgi:hypothetical protein